MLEDVSVEHTTVAEQNPPVELVNESCLNDFGLLRSCSSSYRSSTIAISNHILIRSMLMAVTVGATTASVWVVEGSSMR